VPRRLTLPLVLAGALVAFALLPGSGSAADPVLTGDVGLNDAFLIGLADASGNRVTHLDPGTYTLVVHDHSVDHNFDLFGPSVNVKTDVGAVGDFTFTITLTDGTYSYVCDPHATVMKGSFTVGTPPVETPPPTPAPLPRKMAAAVGGGKITLRGAFAAKAGKTVITVRDSSIRDNFHLSGQGIDKKTGVAFRGTVVWTVTLRTGTYMYRSDRHAKLRGSFRVR
jgi:hypothetical protein